MGECGVNVWMQVVESVDVNDERTEQPHLPQPSTTATTTPSPTLDRLFVHSPSAITADQQELALNLYKYLDSISKSTSHLFETETTLNHDPRSKNPTTNSIGSLVSEFGGTYRWVLADLYY